MHRCIPICTDTKRPSFLLHKKVLKILICVKLFEKNGTKHKSSGIGPILFKGVLKLNTLIG